jgi:hypothetical protein
MMAAPTGLPDDLIVYLLGTSSDRHGSAARCVERYPGIAELLMDLEAEDNLR